MATRVGTESDADLVAAAGTGDEHASGELFRRHHTAVLGYARGLVRDQHAAEDLTSEAFARTLAALRQGMGPREAYRPYLYTVVRNTAADWARSGRRTVVTDEVAEWADRPADEPPDLEELDALVRAFRSLPERWQTVLWHTIIEDEPVQQVAELLGMEPGAVAQLSFRAREGLRQAFLTASCEGDPECAEFTAQLAASVRRPGRRRGRALRSHLASCAGCRRTAEEMSDLNARLRRALPVGVVALGAPSAPLGVLAPAGGGAALPGWALPAGVAGAGGAALLAVLFATVGLGPAERKPPKAAAPNSPPAMSASPAPTRRLQPAQNGGTPTVAPKRIKSAKQKPPGAGPAPNGVFRIRSATLQSCLAPAGSSVVQRPCGDSATAWRRKNTGGGFTLTSGANGKCMSRGTESDSVPWEGATKYAVTTAPCGGPHQIWKFVRSGGVGGARLANGDGWYLQASYSGLQPVTLKSSSFSGMAAQGWVVQE
ncbi:sigma-70 family RNA polymerase sigma factor [Actinomadura rudentiformis]|uniref:sigma-70 family RNA polymerase sigma factor n=1 Tax=Actinomadura rudentiformis TaxID=359158 RepID=UPI00178C794F|nr:sigma-70 family RNA polymerase sigma factor [Actinomadura rudentiformis]